MWIHITCSRIHEYGWFCVYTIPNVTPYGSSLDIWHIFISMMKVYTSFSLSMVVSTLNNAMSANSKDDSKIKYWQTRQFTFLCALTQWKVKFEYRFQIYCEPHNVRQVKKPKCSEAGVTLINNLVMVTDLVVKVPF